MGDDAATLFEKEIVFWKNNGYAFRRVKDTTVS